MVTNTTLPIESGYCGTDTGTPGFEYVAMTEYINNRRWKDTTDRDRSVILKQFQDALIASPYGPTDRDDLVFCTSRQFDSTNPSRTAQTDYPELLTGSEALEYFADRHTRLTLFWGDPVASTQDLVLVDIDKPHHGEGLPDTLTVNSGMDGHYHKIYHNVDGSVRNEFYHSGSKVNARPIGRWSSWTVVPGTVHNKTKRVYHMMDPSGSPIADLHPSDLPAVLRA